MNPYIIIGLLVAWALSLAGVGAWQNSAGHVAERSAWQGREVKELTAANLAIKTLEEAARKIEADHDRALDLISTAYEERLSHASKQRVSDLAAVRAGTLRLRDPAAAVRSCVDSMPGITAGSGVGDGREAGELSGIAAEFLLGEAIRADSLAEQLAAAQAVIRADRGM